MITDNKFVKDDRDVSNVIKREGRPTCKLWKSIKINLLFTGIRSYGDGFPGIGIGRFGHRKKICRRREECFMYMF